MSVKEEKKIKQMILYQGDKQSNKDFKEENSDDIFDHVYFQAHLA